MSGQNIQLDLTNIKRKKSTLIESPQGALNKQIRQPFSAKIKPKKEEALINYQINDSYIRYIKQAVTSRQKLRVNNYFEGNEAVLESPIPYVKASASTILQKKWQSYMSNKTKILRRASIQQKSNFGVIGSGITQQKNSQQQDCFLTSDQLVGKIRFKQFKKVIINQESLGYLKGFETIQDLNEIQFKDFAQEFRQSLMIKQKYPKRIQHKVFKVKISQFNFLLFIQGQLYYSSTTVKRLKQFSSFDDGIKIKRIALGDYNYLQYLIQYPICDGLVFQYLYKASQQQLLEDNNFKKDLRSFLLINTKQDLQYNIKHYQLQIQRIIGFIQTIPIEYIIKSLQHPQISEQRLYF